MRGSIYASDGKDYAGMKFGVRVFDLKFNKFYAFEITPGFEESWKTMRATDGGLVCFVCTYLVKNKKERLPILVCNPLTQDRRALPLNTLKAQPRMVQLVMDRLSKSY